MNYVILTSLPVISSYNFLVKSYFCCPCFLITYLTRSVWIWGKYIHTCLIAFGIFKLWSPDGCCLLPILQILSFFLVLVKLLPRLATQGVYYEMQCNVKWNGGLLGISDAIWICLMRNHSDMRTIAHTPPDFTRFFVLKTPFASFSVQIREVFGSRCGRWTLLDASFAQCFAIC